MSTEPLRLIYADPATLDGNPANWRIHSPEQGEAVRAAIAECGWARPLLYNEQTARFVDGHLRRSLYRGEIVPILIGSWDEAKEAKLLATLDTTGMLAETDAAAFDQLLRQVETSSTELQELLAAVADSAGLYRDAEMPAVEVEIAVDGPLDPAAEDAEEDAPEPPGFAPAPAPDCVWPSDNDHGIPALDPAMQADAFDFPCTVWGTQARGKAMRGTWLFYTADRKFEPIWRDPNAVLRSNPAACVEPNFSTHPEHPRAFVLWNVYRKRWLARWWQSQGVRVFVDLNVDAEFAADNLLGVPKGWKAFATRSHSEGAHLEREFALACEHAGTDRILFLVYGGGEHAKKLAQAKGWKWVPEQSDSARDARFGKGVRRSFKRSRRA